MSNYMKPGQKCTSCGSSFAWNGRQWMIASPEGHLTLGATRTEKPEPAPEILRCPQCHCLLSAKAKVEEVVE